MFVKEFAEKIAWLAEEIGCDGGTWINGHKMPSYLSAYDEETGSSYEIVEVLSNQLFGCGCYGGIVIKIKRKTTLLEEIMELPEEDRLKLIKDLTTTGEHSSCNP